MQAELKGNPKNSGNRSQIRELTAGPSTEAGKRRWWRHPFIPLPLRAFDENAQALAISDRRQRIATRMRESHASMPLDEIGRGAGDPGKLAKTPGLNQDKISN